MFDFMKPKTLHARVQNIDEISASFMDNFIRWYKDKSKFFTFDCDKDGSIAFVDQNNEVVYKLSSVDYMETFNGANIVLVLHHILRNDPIDTYCYDINIDTQKIQFTLYYSMEPTIGSRYNVINEEKDSLRESDDLFHIIKDFFSHCILKMAMYIEKQEEGDLLNETIPDFSRW